jgi:hypothetical protein
MVVNDCFTGSFFTFETHASLAAGANACHETHRLIIGKVRGRHGAHRFTRT